MIVVMFMVTMRVIMMIGVISLALRNGKRTTPQQTSKRSLGRARVLGRFEGRHDSFLDTAGHGGHVPSGAVRQERLQPVWASERVSFSGGVLVMLMIVGVTVTVAVVGTVPIGSCMGLRMRMSGRTRMVLPAGLWWLDGGQGTAGRSSQIGQIDLVR